MSAVITQVFVITSGPHVGKTCNIVGHAFVEGRLAFRGSAEQVQVLTNIFSFNGIEPDRGGAPAVAADEQNFEAHSTWAEPPAPAAEQAATEQPVPQDSRDDATGEDGSLEQQGEDADLQAMLGKPSLGEAVAALDPENDAHWTSNNLPNLEALTGLTGSKVARGQVEAIASGYTRAKAKVAKQG